MSREFVMRSKLHLCVVLLILTSASSAESPGSRLAFREDLRRFGLDIVARNQGVVNYTDLAFLSEDLLLVVVNLEESGVVVYPFKDEPASRLLIFEVSQKRLVRSADRNVEKSIGSIRATEKGHFALLDEAGVRVCSSDLACGQPVKSRGPLLASPQGTKLVVGGNAQTEQRLLDSSTLKEIDRFPHRSDLIPGDNLLIFDKQGLQYLRVPGKLDFKLAFTGPDLRVEQFLSDDIVAGFSVGNAVIAKVDGKILWHIPVKDASKSHFFPCAGGSRVGVYEGGYTKWNSFVNFLDTEDGRPYNVELVRVLETESGKLALELKWDPRPFRFTAPALSPSGHRIALLRGGFLEVFELS
jgi:hypothetical protein